MSRNALVTGAARGIGRAIALRLATDGFNVAVNDINARSTELNDIQKAIEKIGRKSVAITADVSNDKEVETMMKNTAKQLGSLDVCIMSSSLRTLLFLSNNIGRNRQCWNCPSQTTSRNNYRRLG